MEFSRQEYWSGSPFPSAGDRPDSGIEPRSLASQADSQILYHLGDQGSHTAAQNCINAYKNILHFHIRLLKKQKLIKASLLL